MPKKTGIIFVTLGAVLMLSALLLFIYNELESRNAGREAEILLDGIKSAFEEAKHETQPETIKVSIGVANNTTLEETLDPVMPTVLIDGYEYIGYVSIPDLELELPVMSEWDYNRLKVAPVRHFGSSRTDDLVIAAHNYKTHFGSLSTLKIGDEIRFTDMDGVENRYTLSALRVLSADAVAAVQNSGHDLVLYTCTPESTSRVVAFCDRAQTESDGS